MCIRLRTTDTSVLSTGIMYIAIIITSVLYYLQFCGHMIHSGDVVMKPFDVRAHGFSYTHNACAKFGIPMFASRSGVTNIVCGRADTSATRPPRGGGRGIKEMEMWRRAQLQTAGYLERIRSATMMKSALAAALLLLLVLIVVAAAAAHLQPQTHVQRLNKLSSSNSLSDTWSDCSERWLTHTHTHPHPLSFPLSRR